MTGPVLVVDDDRDVLHAARLALAGTAARIDTSHETADLEGRVAHGGYEAVLLDMNFVVGDQTGGEGLVHLDRLRSLDPDLSIVLMTTFGSVSLAVEAMKRGGKDFLLKPWRNDRLVEAMVVACKQTRAARRDTVTFDLEATEKQEIQRALEHFEGNISKSAAALKLSRAALHRRMAKYSLGLR